MERAVQHGVARTQVKGHATAREREFARQEPRAERVHDDSGLRDLIRDTQGMTGQPFGGAGQLIAGPSPDGPIH